LPDFLQVPSQCDGFLQETATSRDYLQWNQHESSRGDEYYCMTNPGGLNTLIHGTREPSTAIT
jgi:hypothetical protein